MAARLTQIRDFIAAVDAGSLRAGARTLGISQPALTKSIRQLEDHLHVKLLQRSARGAVLTRSGKTFLARARVIQSELAKIEADLREQDTPNVAIGASPATVVLLIPDAVDRLRRRGQNARLRLVEGLTESLIPQVRDESLDFAVGQKAGSATDKMIAFTPLLRVSLVIAARRGHPLAGAGSLRELATAPWIAFAAANAARFIDRAYGALGVAPPRHVIQCDSYASALALMTRTDALGLMVPQLLAQEPYRACLQQIAVGDELPALTFGVFRRTDGPLSRPAKAMLEALTATARSLSRSERRL